MSKGAKAMLAALRPGTTRSLSEQTDVALASIGRARQVIEFCDRDLVEAVKWLR
jgi:hypothetical protein